MRQPGKLKQVAKHQVENPRQGTVHGPSDDPHNITLK